MVKKPQPEDPFALPEVIIVDTSYQIILLPSGQILSIKWPIIPT